jgi:hypothetical protein
VTLRLGRIAPGTSRARVVTLLVRPGTHRGHVTLVVRASAPGVASAVATSRVLVR